MAEIEEWKDIKGYNGAYRVSNYGRVLSVGRIVRKGGKTGEMKTKDMFLSQRADFKGYMRVYLKDKGKTRFIAVHRLVALAFIPNPLNKPQVNHIDGNKTNNLVSNLEWCTNGENQKHAYRLGLNYVTGKAGRPKIGVKQIDTQTGETLAWYASMNEAERHTRVFAQNIKKVVQGTRKTAGGFIWKEATAWAD